MGCAFVMTIMYLSWDSQPVADAAVDQIEVPNRNLTIPRMPAMLETLLAPNRAPSLRRMSPDGRSITSVCAEGEEGEVKA